MEELTYAETAATRPGPKKQQGGPGPALLAAFLPLAALPVMLQVRRCSARLPAVVAALPAAQRVHSSAGLPERVRMADLGCMTSLCPGPPQSCQRSMTRPFSLPCFDGASLALLTLPCSCRAP